MISRRLVKGNPRRIWDKVALVRFFSPSISASHFVYQYHPICAPHSCICLPQLHCVICSTCAKNQWKQIEKPSIRADSNPDEIPKKYLHNKYKELKLYQCAAWGLKNNEYHSSNAYRSLDRESDQRKCLCRTTQNNWYTSDPSGIRICNSCAWEGQNRAAVTRLQIA